MTHLILTFIFLLYLKAFLYLDIILFYKNDYKIYYLLNNI